MSEKKMLLDNLAALKQQMVFSTLTFTLGARAQAPATFPSRSSSYRSLSISTTSYIHSSHRGIGTQPSPQQIASSISGRVRLIIEHSDLSFSP